jgi:hypothetical protein
LEAVQKEAGWPAIEQNANPEASGSSHKGSGMKFTEELSNKALLHFRNLGKLRPIGMK